MIEINSYTIACCDNQLGNHYFKDFPFANASDVETYFGLPVGSVTYIDTNGSEGYFKTIVEYDIENGVHIINSPQVYYDYWGLIRDVLTLSGAPIPVSNIDFFSYKIRNIEAKGFHLYSNSKLKFNFIESINGNAFFQSSDLEIIINDCKNMSNSSFSDITNMTLRLAPSIKTMNFIGTTPDLFVNSTGTIYCSLEFSLLPLVAASLAANPSITLITY